MRSLELWSDRNKCTLWDDSTKLPGVISKALKVYIKYVYYLVFWLWIDSVTHHCHIIFGNLKLQNNHNYKASTTNQSLKFKCSSHLSPNSIGFWRHCTQASWNHCLHLQHCSIFKYQLPKRKKKKFKLILFKTIFYYIVQDWPPIHNPPDLASIEITGVHHHCYLNYYLLMKQGFFLKKKEKNYII